MTIESGGVTPGLLGISGKLVKYWNKNRKGDNDKDYCPNNAINKPIETILENSIVIVNP